MDEWIKLILDRWGLIGATILIAIMYRGPLSTLVMRVIDSGSSDIDHTIEHALEAHDKNRRLSEERVSDRLSAILDTLKSIERILGDIRVVMAEIRALKEKK